MQDTLREWKLLLNWGMSYTRYQNLPFRAGPSQQIFYTPTHENTFVDLPRQEEMAKPSEAKLSIVVPTYNESNNIVRMLDSIAETLSAYNGAEIIVVDDNSPDGTAEMAKSHAKILSGKKKIRVEIIRRKAKSGVSSAIVKGVKSAT